MDMHTEGNGGFQALEGTSPFEGSSQFQGDGYTGVPCQEPAAEPVWYGEADGAGLPVGTYQEAVMQTGGYDNVGAAETLPAGPYQETLMETAGDGSTYGAEDFSAAPYQELPAGTGAETYMGEADALPVATGQMPIQETEDLGMYQETVELGSADPQAAEDQEMADLEATEPESAETELEETETGETELPAAEAAPDADKEDDEETKRIKHETAEAERKAEWEEKQQAKKAAEQEKLDRLANMSDDAAVAAAMKQVGAETEKLTRRNMKDCVAEYVQTLCLEDPGFARMVMHPRKNMIRCFHYINRKAKEFIRQEMEDNDIKPENGVYGGDVPDDLCYQWAEEYFRDPDAEEDREKEEKFEPRPYTGKSGSKAKAKKAAEKKTAAKKSTATKPADKKAGKPGQEADGQMSFPGQISLSDIMAPEVKAG